MWCALFNRKKRINEPRLCIFQCTARWKTLKVESCTGKEVHETFMISITSPSNSQTFCIKTHFLCREVRRISICFILKIWGFSSIIWSFHQSPFGNSPKSGHAYHWVGSQTHSLGTTDLYKYWRKEHLLYWYSVLKTALWENQLSMSTSGTIIPSISLVFLVWILKRDCPWEVTEQKLKQ